MHSPKVLGIGIVVVMSIRGDDVLSVCDLLKNPASHNGQIVKVRGLYHVDSEGVDIRDLECRTRLVINGQEWSPSLWLVAESGPPASTYNPELDVAAYKGLIKAEEEARGRGELVRAVFEGRLRYCPVSRRQKGGRSIWIGCGHMGDYAAQLVLHKVTDIRQVESAGKKPK
jgi:hypothetical protein